MSDLSRAIHAGRTLGGRYTLRRLIDKGGMAEVWEGEDSVLGRAVAIKVLYPHLAHDASFSERFRLEAIAAARLAHPNVVATYDTGIDDGLAFIVMELVDGHTLREELADGPLSPTLARGIAAQVADALDYAHGAGIVHRDIKPANILLCPDGRAKVADFGIAKAALGDGEPARDLTGTGAIIGTAKYLSPEQVDGRMLDGRSDVYALGVVLYEMLCGRPPFTGDTDMAIGIQHLSARPASPRSIRPGIPLTLEAVAMRALEKSPADRYQSASAMHAALVGTDVGGDLAAPDAAGPGPDATRTGPSGPWSGGPGPS
ncbi:MAG: protein kinase, partial [Actinomycetota bacterium]|nr:protein kinase [Actinomycetota bacterium]